MINMELAYLIGFGTVALLSSIGAWRVYVEKNQEYCDGCCNPDHWTAENRAKLSPEQYETMKANVILFAKRD